MHRRCARGGATCVVDRLQGAVATGSSHDGAGAGTLQGSPVRDRVGKEAEGRVVFYSVAERRSKFKRSS